MGSRNGPSVENCGRIVTLGVSIGLAEQLSLLPSFAHGDGVHPRCSGFRHIGNTRYSNDHGGGAECTDFVPGYLKQ